MRLCLLGELLELSDSGVWGDEDPNNGISVLRSTNFNADGTLDLSKLTFRALEPRNGERKLLLPGDILLEKSGGGPKQPVGRVCLFKGADRPHSFGNFIARLRPRKDVLSEYLFYFLWYFHAIGKTGYYQKQTTGIRNLELQRYLGIDVPVPSFEEQTGVVDVLTRAAGIVRLRHEARTKAQAVLPALFVDMFGDLATNPKGWDIRSVRSFVSRFEGGKNLQAANEGSTVFKILKVSAVTSGAYIESESKPTPMGYVPPSNHVIRPGDMLFSRANTQELVGATALVERTNGHTLLPDKIWRFIWSEEVAQEYMLALFQARFVRDELSNLSSGTSSSMRNISQEKLYRLSLPIAPISLQHAFAQYSRAINSIHSKQRTALKNAELTFFALLSFHFTLKGPEVSLARRTHDALVSMHAEA